MHYILGLLLVATFTALLLDIVSGFFYFVNPLNFAAKFRTEHFVKGKGLQSPTNNFKKDHTCSLNSDYSALTNMLIALKSCGMRCLRKNGMCLVKPFNCLTKYNGLFDPEALTLQTADDPIETRLYNAMP